MIVLFKNMINKLQTDNQLVKTEKHKNLLVYINYFFPRTVI